MENIIYLNMVQMERNHWWYKGRQEIITTLLAPYLFSAKDILDAGCGAGGTMEIMSKFGTVVGIDISSEMVEHCQNMGLSASCNSILELPFDNNSFDLILCLDVLEHLKDEAEALEELKRVLRPGGLIALSVPAFSWLWGRHDDMNEHFRRYDFGMLENVIRLAGLSVERSTYFNFLLLPAVGLVRKIGNLFPNKGTKTDFQFGYGIMNSVLFSILRFESKLLGHINIPIGVSQVVLAKKD